VELGTAAALSARSEGHAFELQPLTSWTMLSDVRNIESAAPTRADDNYTLLRCPIL
jgi:hypothetical protein